MRQALVIPSYYSTHYSQVTNHESLLTNHTICTISGGQSRNLSIVTLFSDFSIATPHATALAEVPITPMGKMLCIPEEPSRQKPYY
jgi:hypothetical protein